jgi:hypothetical protein
VPPWRSWCGSSRSDDPVAGRLLTRRYAAAVAVAALLVAILPLSTCGGGQTNPCATPQIAAPSVPLREQKMASRVALALPFVRRLLVGRDPSNVVVNVQGNRKGSLIGVQVLIRFSHPVLQVDATWPWLFVDDTGTMRPPYQIIRQHAQARGLSMIEITMLAPTYTRGVVSNWAVAPGGRIAPVSGAHDQRPPQAECD